MDLRIFSVILVSLSSIRSSGCELIDYKKAAEIFNAQGNYFVNSEFQEDDFLQTRSIFSNPVSRFINFMRDHEKVYSSEEDLFSRHENFIANVERAEDYQSLDRGSATYNINKFFDFSDEEFSQLIGLNVNDADQYVPTGLFDYQQRELSHIDHIGADFEYQQARKTSGSLPTAVDWRDRGVISRVKYQGDCSSCWAFSTIGVVEAMHAIQSDNLTELSVQQLVDCDSADDGCQGGTMDTALQYIMSAGGVVSAKDYPYIGRSHDSCLKLDRRFKVQVKQYTRIPYGGEDQMLEWVATRGPLSVGVNADGLFYYAGGVMDLREKLCDPDKQNHALIVVGYGEEKRLGRSTIPYWIVKNSWGEDWGEKGYFRIRRNTNACGIGVFVHGVITK